MVARSLHPARTGGIRVNALGRFDYLLKEYGHQTIDSAVPPQRMTLNFGDGLPTWKRGLTARLSESLRSDKVELGAGENQCFLIR